MLTSSLCGNTLIFAWCKQRTTKSKIHFYFVGLGRRRFGRICRLGERRLDWNNLPKVQSRKGILHANPDQVREKLYRFVIFSLSIYSIHWLNLFNHLVDIRIVTLFHKIKPKKGSTVAQWYVICFRIWFMQIQNQVRVRH